MIDYASSTLDYTSSTLAATDNTNSAPGGVISWEALDSTIREYDSAIREYETLIHQELDFSRIAGGDHPNREVIRDELRRMFRRTDIRTYTPRADTPSLATMEQDVDMAAEARVLMNLSLF